MEDFLFKAPVYIDYLWLMEQLKDYASPRAKITSLFKKKYLLRIKKGLYVIGPAYNRPYCKEVIANLIYGPSYVSLEWALAYYGLLAERVERVTSMTNKRNKNFVTPVGSFDYFYLASPKYEIGVKRVQGGEGEFFYIASLEKALCDLIAQKKELVSAADIQTYLFDNLRMQSNFIKDFDLKLLQSIVKTYKKKSLGNFLQFLKK